MTRSKAKGTRGERLVVGYLAEQGFDQAERRALAGTQDRGDIAGVPGWTIEVKNTQQTLLAAWIDEMTRERIRARTPYGAVVAMRRLKPVERAYAVMELEQLVRLIKEVDHAVRVP